MNKIGKTTLSLLFACGSLSICGNLAQAQAERETLLAEGYGWQSQQTSSNGITGVSGGSTMSSGQPSPLEGSMLYGQMNQVLNQSNASGSSSGASTAGLGGTTSSIDSNSFGATSLSGGASGLGDVSGTGLNAAGSAANALGGSSLDSNGVGLSGSGSNGFGAPGLETAGFGQSAGNSSGLGSIESGAPSIGAGGLGAGGIESGSTLPDTTTGGSISGMGSSAGSPELGTTSEGSDSNGSDTAAGVTKEEPSRSNAGLNAPSVEFPKENTPMRKALSALRAGRYEDCLVKLDEILRSQPNNAQAHYLKAVAYVMMRHYPQAAEEYRSTLANSPDAEISKLARLGLAKLGR